MWANDLLKKYLDQNSSQLSPEEAVTNSANLTPMQPPVEPVSDATTDQTQQPPAAPQRSPASVPASPQALGAASPEMFSQLRALLDRQTGEQQNTVDSQKAALIAKLGKTQGVDLSPAFEVVKAAGGRADAGKSYTAPEDTVASNTKDLEGLIKSQGDIAKETTSRLKDELSAKLFGTQVSQAQQDRNQNTKDRASMMYNQKMAETLDPSHASNATTFGNFAKTINAADKLNALAQQQPDLNFSSNQMTELATAGAQMLSGGSVIAQQQIEHLLPPGVERSAAGILNWFTGEPHGTGQIGFAKQLLETAAREHDLAAEKLYDAQTKKLSGFEKYRRLNFEDYKTVKDTYVTKPERRLPDTLSQIRNKTFNASAPDATTGASNQAVASPTLSPKDQAAINWAKSNPNDPRAAKIMQLHGM